MPTKFQEIENQSICTPEAHSQPANRLLPVFFCNMMCTVHLSFLAVIPMFVGLVIWNLGRPLDTGQAGCFYTDAAAQRYVM